MQSKIKIFNDIRKIKLFNKIKNQIFNGIQNINIQLHSKL